MRLMKYVARPIYEGKNRNYNQRLEDKKLWREWVLLTSFYEHRNEHCNALRQGVITWPGEQLLTFQ
jgi:hypothetical protein